MLNMHLELLWDMWITFQNYRKILKDVWWKHDYIETIHIKKFCSANISLFIMSMDKLIDIISLQSQNKSFNLKLTQSTFDMQTVNNNQSTLSHSGSFRSNFLPVCLRFDGEYIQQRMLTTGALIPWMNYNVNILMLLFNIMMENKWKHGIWSLWIQVRNNTKFS